jgi:mycofactocin precursor
MDETEQAQATTPEAPASEPHGADEELIEEISIDGMCGVY